MSEEVLLRRGTIWFVVNVCRPERRCPGIATHLAGFQWSSQVISLPLNIATGASAIVWQLHRGK